MYKTFLTFILLRDCKTDERNPTRVLIKKMIAQLDLGVHLFLIATFHFNQRFERCNEDLVSVVTLSFRVTSFGASYKIHKITSF